MEVRLSGGPHPCAFQGAGFNFPWKLLRISFNLLPWRPTPVLSMIYSGYIFILTIVAIRGILPYGRLAILLPAALTPANS